MFDNNQDIDPQKLAFWDKEFKQYGIKVLPETAMFYELESFFPSYVFIDKQSIDRFGADGSDNHAEAAGSRLAFFSRDDKPYFSDENGNIQWFDIEPLNLCMLNMRLQEMLPSVGLRHGVEGYIIPLQENTFFESREDVNAYLHNLMFWESFITSSQAGPLMQRFFWISQKLYKMRNDQRDSVVMLRDAGFKNISIAEEDYKVIISQMLKQKKEHEHGLTEFVAERTQACDMVDGNDISEYLQQRKEEERNEYDKRVRSEEIYRQVQDLMSRIYEINTRIIDYTTIEEKLLERLKGEKQ